MIEFTKKNVQIQQINAIKTQTQSMYEMSTRRNKRTKLFEIK